VTGRVDKGKKGPVSAGRINCGLDKNQVGQWASRNGEEKGEGGGLLERRRERNEPELPSGWGGGGGGAKLPYHPRGRGEKSHLKGVKGNNVGWGRAERSKLVEACRKLVGAGKSLLKHKRLKAPGTSPAAKKACNNLNLGARRGRRVLGLELVSTLGVARRRGRGRRQPNGGGRRLRKWQNEKDEHAISCGWGTAKMEGSTPPQSRGNPWFS